MSLYQHHFGFLNTELLLYSYASKHVCVCVCVCLCVCVHIFVSEEIAQMQ